MDINFLGLREVQLKGLEGRLIYSNGTIIGISFDTEQERDDFLRTIDDYSKDLIHTFEYVN